MEHFGKAFASRLLAAYGLLAIAMLAANRLTSRAERRIGETLPSRTSRGIAVPLGMMLGRARLAILVVTIGIEAVLAVLLFALLSGWFAWSFLAAYAVACTLVAIGVRQASRRATVSVDPTSLAIDERLRSEDAFHAAYPLSLIILAFPVGGMTSGPDWFILVWGIVGAGILVLWSFGMQSPWRQRIRLTDSKRAAFVGSPK